MMAHSVGIIGGADGPTAIFVTNKISPAAVVAFCIILAVLIVLALVWLWKNHK